MAAEAGTAIKAAAPTLLAAPLEPSQTCSCSGTGAGATGKLAVSAAPCQCQKKSPPAVAPTALNALDLTPAPKLQLEQTLVPARLRAKLAALAPQRAPAVRAPVVAKAQAAVAPPPKPAPKKNPTIALTMEESLALAERMRAQSRATIAIKSVEEAEKRAAAARKLPAPGAPVQPPRGRLPRTFEESLAWAIALP